MNLSGKQFALCCAKMLRERSPRDIECRSEFAGIVVTGALEVASLDGEFEDLALSLCQFVSFVGLRDRISVGCRPERCDRVFTVVVLQDVDTLLNGCLATDDRRESGVICVDDRLYERDTEIDKAALGAVLASLALARRRAN